MKPSLMYIKSIIPITVILFLLLCGCASAPVEQQREADLHFRLGLSNMDEGNYQMAYIQFQMANKIEPKNKDILNGLGVVYLHFEELEKSKSYFLAAIAIDDNFSTAHNNLGTVYLKLSKWDEAIEHFKKSLSNPMNQNPESAYFNLGTAYYRLNQYESAITAFKHALKRVPDFLPSYYGLALAYNKTGRYGEASEMLTKAIEMDNAYNKDKTKFIQEIRKQYLKSDQDNPDIEDYLEIVNY